MKKSKFTESQITASIRAYEAGKDVQQICRELKINRAIFYNWKRKYSGIDAELLRQFKEVQRENAEPNHMYADLLTKPHISQESYAGFQYSYLLF